MQVLRRGVFEYIDDARAAEVVHAYRGLWAGYRNTMADEAARPKTAEQCWRAPSRISAAAARRRDRGPSGPHRPGHEPIRQEIVTGLGQAAFVPAITRTSRPDGRDSGHWRRR